MPLCRFSASPFCSSSTTRTAELNSTSMIRSTAVWRLLAHSLDLGSAPIYRTTSVVIGISEGRVTPPRSTTASTAGCTPAI